MAQILVTAGVALLAAAVLGGGLKMLGAEIPVVSSVSRQVVTGLLGATLLLLGMYGGDTMQNDGRTTTSTPARSSVLSTARGTITAPSGGRVSRETTAAGTVMNLPEGHHIFLLVQKGRFYPQSRSIRLLNDGTWSVSVLFGQTEDVGVEFVLSLVEAGPVGTKAFEDYFDTAERTGRYQGFLMKDLPSDMTLLATVHVTRG